MMSCTIWRDKFVITSQDRHPGTNYRIVDTSPFSSPLPREELNSYELVYQSETTTTLVGETLPSMEILKYLGSTQS
jgi:hypothetical protein